MKQLFIILAFSINSLCALPFTTDMMEEGHSVFVTKNADESQEWKLRLIREAKSSLEIAPGFCHGHVFEDLLDAIHLKLEENKDIRIHFLPSQLAGLISDSDHQFLDLLTTTYPGRFDYFTTHDAGFVTQEGQTYITENHIKLIIADEKYFILGGTNLVDHLSTMDINKYQPKVLATHFMPRAASDMDVIISGPMAKKLRHEFFDFYALFKNQEPLEQDLGEFTPAETAYFPIEDQTAIAFFDENEETSHDTKVYAVISGPRMRLHTIGNMYIHLISNAASSIDIGNMYLFPPHSIYDALMKAANRDVALSVVTNGSHDDFSVSISSRSMYGHLNRLNYFPLMAGTHFKFHELFTAKEALQKNTRVYELNLPGVLLHKKIMTVDNRYSLIGSYNLGLKSENADYEVAAIIESSKTATQFEDVLLHDKVNSNEISYFQAMGWYFNPYYVIIESFERKFIDGFFL
jgi:phosphatidylserine/phosphatidylglycerophosphate/cardiolipin synthase-like enzyme